MASTISFFYITHSLSIVPHGHGLSYSINFSYITWSSASIPLCSSNRYIVTIYHCIVLMLPKEWHDRMVLTLVFPCSEQSQKCLTFFANTFLIFHYASFTCSSTLLACIPTCHFFSPVGLSVHLCATAYIVIDCSATLYLRSGEELVGACAVILAHTEPHTPQDLFLLHITS